MKTNFRTIQGNANVNPVHVEYAKTICNIQDILVINKISFSLANGFY